MTQLLYYRLYPKYPFLLRYFKIEHWIFKQTHKQSLKIKAEPGMKILNMIGKAEYKNDNDVNQIFIDFCYLCITLNKH